MRENLVYSSFSLAGLKNAILRWHMGSLMWGSSSIPWNTSFLCTQGIGYYYLQSGKKKIIGDNINISSINSIVSKTWIGLGTTKMIKNLFLAVLDRQNKSWHPFVLMVLARDDSPCEWGEQCWQPSPCGLPSHPCQGFCIRDASPGCGGLCMDV